MAKEVDPVRNGSPQGRINVTDGAASNGVDEFIADSPEWAKNTLEELRRVIREAAPDAKESISYHMPYYSLSGRLAYFNVYADHCSFHWISAEDKKNFSKQLEGQKVKGSTLQIPRGEKVPSALIKKIVRSRVKSNQRTKKR